MKKLICALFVGSCLFAHAETKPYVSIYAGGSGLQETDYDGDVSGSKVSGDLKFDVDAVYGIAVGTSIADLPIRVELEYSYRKSSCDVVKVTSPSVLQFDGKGSSVKTDLLMGNIYYDFTEVDSPVIPYIFGGLGVAFVDVLVEPSAGVFVKGDKTVFAGQVGLGAGWPITDHIILDVKGRLVMTEDINLSNNTGIDSLVYVEVLAGIRLQF